MGDFNGIGPEVALKTLINNPQNGTTAPVLIGHPEVCTFYLKRSDLDAKVLSIDDISDAKEGRINMLCLNGLPDPDIKPGAISESAGLWSMKAVEKGVELCMDGSCDALVTAPISKESIQKAGYNFPGHTEFLADKTDTSEYMMILASEGLRVGLITGHQPLKEVAGSISRDGIRRKLDVLNRSLKRDFGIEKPKIAVFGLNPHAGDGGVLGTEEIDIITPAIQSAVADGIDAKGPFPADGFFGNRMQDDYDGILAMYHDQGLVPFKALTFGSGINFTAGLPMIRTSPDHGTAFGIAGNNRADERSFAAAYSLACRLAENRRKVTA